MIQYFRELTSIEIIFLSIGLSTLEREYEDILLSLGANKFEIFYKIALPKTLPDIVSASPTLTPGPRLVFWTSVVASLMKGFLIFSTAEVSAPIKNSIAATKAHRLKIDS